MIRQLQGAALSNSQRLALGGGSVFGRSLALSLRRVRQTPAELELTTTQGQPFTFVPVFDINTSYCHSQRSLGMGSQLLIGIGVTALTGGMCPLPVIGSVVGNAAISSLATSAIGNAYAGKPLVSASSLRDAVFADITAGLTGVLSEFTGLNAAANAWVVDRAHKVAISTASRTLVGAVRGEGNLGRHLLQGAVQLGLEYTAHEIGAFHHGLDETASEARLSGVRQESGVPSLKELQAPNFDLTRTLPALLMHGAAGAVAGQILHHDPAAGAVGAVVGELAGMGLKELGVGREWGVAGAQVAAVLSAGAFNQDPEIAAFTGPIAARENALMLIPVAMALAPEAAAALTAALLEVGSAAALLALYESGYFGAFVDATFEGISDLWAAVHMDAHPDTGPKVESFPGHPERPQILATPEANHRSRDEGFTAADPVRPQLPGFAGYTGPDTRVLTAESADKGARARAEGGRHNKTPYHPRQMERLLKEQHPGSTISSTTLPDASMPNVRLAGGAKVLPDGTELPFCIRGMPVFDKHILYEMRLPMESFNKSSEAHMREATRALRVSIEKGEVNPKLFTTEQLAAIQAGSPHVPDLTWHHHQELGRMQFLSRELHKEIKHVGGMGLKDKSQ